MNAKQRILGGLWGAIVGDALGVPVEFTDREERRRDPVASMRGGGIWRQPPGTWSDDSSLLLCSVESLRGGFDTEDMGRRFVDWHNAERWTPWGKVFDIGMTTREALLTVEARPKPSALVELASNSFNHHVHGRAGFEALARLVDHSDCLDLRYSRLDEALAWARSLEAPQ